MYFSIIIPVYNVEKYIDQCLESVVTQEFDSFEVILVNDGSTDSSGARCDAYAEKYVNVRVIHQENKGLSGARNAGLDVAVGEWILFVDSDDWIEVGMLRKLYMQMREEVVDLYSYNAYKVGEQGKLIQKLIYVPENETVHFIREKDMFEYVTNRLMQYEIGWEVWSRAFRRNLIEEKKIRFRECSEVFAEDYLFTFQYMLCARRVKHLCSVFYFYRQRKGSLIHNINQNTVLERLFQWAEEAYRTVKKEKLSYFAECYEVVYFRLLNHHIQYMLSDYSPENLKKDLRLLKEKRLHRKWIKRLVKRQNELWKEMKVTRWL